MNVLRQTGAFVLAAAIKALHPEVRLGEGEAADDGFYYDTDREDGQLTIDQLPAIDAKMKEIINTRRLKDQHEARPMRKRPSPMSRTRCS